MEQTAEDRVAALERGLAAAVERIEELEAQPGRDAMVRLFNRLDAAVSHHKKAGAGLVTEADESLYHARDRILSDYAAGVG